MNELDSAECMDGTIGAGCGDRNSNGSLGHSDLELDGSRESSKV